jgi:hypothetical protein
MIDSTCSASCFLNHFHSKWGYWLPLLSIEKICPFPVHVYNYTGGRPRPIWFGGTLKWQLSVLENVVSRSSYYLYEVVGNDRYSSETVCSRVLGGRLDCIEEFWRRRSWRRAKKIEGGEENEILYSGR